MPNFVNPESHANQTIIACSIITAIMILFLFLRMYTKVYLTHAVGWDDCENRFIDLTKSRLINADTCIFASVVPDVLNCDLLMSDICSSF